MLTGKAMKNVKGPQGLVQIKVIVMAIENLSNTLDTWIKELQHYNFTQLCTKPSSNSWSLGQVYMHLINETGYFLEQAKLCASTEDNANETASLNARAMLAND